MTDGAHVVPGTRLDDADFTGVRLHGPNFERTRITDGWFPDTDLSGDVSGLRVNGVLVAPLIEAELDRRHPERVRLRATDPAGLLDGWSVIEDLWARLVARALALPPGAAEERVDGEWSFVETLRHLVMATDCWCSRMIHGEVAPYHPWGMAGSFLDPSVLHLDYDARPTLDEMLEVRAGRMAGVRATIESATAASLAAVCTPPDQVGHPREPHTALECLHVVLNEEWEHGQYAARDLTVLEERGS